MSAISPELQKKIDQWLEWDSNPTTRDEILALVKANNVSELQKRLGTRIAFGTAGLRGAMQAGFNSMNNLTVIQASQGLCKYLFSIYGDELKTKGVVVGYDGRHNSLEFARKTAAAFLSQGVKVYLYSVLVPTPFVPFGVLELNALAGVMVTASHNPKDDNGYKVYWGNGCQIVSPHDKGISDAIEQNLVPWKIENEAELLKYHDLLIDPVKVIEESYYKKIVEKYSYVSTSDASKKDIGIVYTPMHGVGRHWAAKAFEAFGLKPFIDVELQKNPDPEFSTVKFPNPEEGKGALKLAMETADANGVKLILANDPDADRLAVAEKLSSGEWKIFNGNEIGTVLADWVWTQHKKKHPEVAPESCVMISTAVSSQMLASICKQEGVTYEETLTGFKWIGSVGEKHIKRGKTLLFGYEEAIGFMVGDICLDKDGIRGIACFAEMAAQLYAKGLSCYDQLTELYKKYGYFVTCNRYFFCYDPKVMKSIFDAIRGSDPKDYPTSCGEFKIKNIRDLTRGYDSNQPNGQPILPVSTSTEMITFYFENNCLVTLRGSGTEPKLKYYCENHGDYKDKDNIAATLHKVVEAVIQHFLRPEQNGLLPPSDE